jgi:predicted AlkP superfamily pyrophosphatase or phosphodiesterase
MNRMRTLPMLLVLLLLSISCRRNHSEPATYTVVVSLDGFRWDYPEIYNTPTLDRMAMEGVKAERMIPSFPTKTFPNHYTLATGLYPDNHGIINNSFYAEELGGIYRMGDRDMVTDPDAYFGEPVWVTAEKQGVRAASYFWVGSEAPVGGTHPSIWKKYDGSVPYSERIGEVVAWLSLPPSRRPGLVLLYFDEPDASGHEFGPVHPSTGVVVARLDSLLGVLRNEISDLPHGDRVNLIVLSDHGMGEVSPSRYTNLMDYIRDDQMVRIVGGNPVYLVDATDGLEEEIMASLETAPGVSAWLREEIPGHFHYGNSLRFPDILVTADSLWSIGTSDDASRYHGGAHGYDQSFSQMHAIFYAEGPAFKQGYVHPIFPNVDVYTIICRSLGLRGADTDGDPGRVDAMFAEGH